MRQIVLDTETTGRDIADGHRIIEIGCIELIDRRLSGKHYHQYVNPERASEAGALAVHGITQEFLSNQPLFQTIAKNFLEFIKGAQLIIHNAPFDIGFLNYELQQANKDYGQVMDYCTVLDTLPLARQLHPGQRNSLDALCKRYGIDNSHRELHGALLDAELLALVYLAMTGGQTSLFGEHTTLTQQVPLQKCNQTQPVEKHFPLRIIYANEAELKAHQAYLTTIEKTAKNGCVWKDVD